MEIGRSYAYREKRVPDVPMLKVKLLDKVGRKGKVKVRFEDGPHPGLEEYVSTRQIVCAWGQRSAVLRDERRAAQPAEYAGRLRDKAVSEAASAVLESTGEAGAYVGETVTMMSEDELQRIFDRAGLEMEPAALHVFGYCDRVGHVHLPLDAMLTVAKAFAAAEPQTVLVYLDDQEESTGRAVVPRLSAPAFARLCISSTVGRPRAGGRDVAQGDRTAPRARVQGRLRPAGRGQRAPVKGSASRPRGSLISPKLGRR